MRLILVALLAGLCAVSAVSVRKSNPNKSFQTLILSLKDSTNYAQKQKDVWRLFKYINQPSYYKDHVEIAHNYHLSKNVAAYSVSTTWSSGFVLRSVLFRNLK
jgi:hypothetical protein